MLRVSLLSFFCLITLAEALPRYLENYRPDHYRRQESYRDALNQNNHLYKLFELLQDASPASGDAPMPDPQDFREDAIPASGDAPMPDPQDFPGDAFPASGDAPIPDTRDFEADAFPGRVYF